MWKGAGNPGFALATAQSEIEELLGVETRNSKPFGVFPHELCCSTRCRTRQRLNTVRFVLAGPDCGRDQGTSAQPLFH
jgi:hypothetical protein